MVFADLRGTGIALPDPCDPSVAYIRANDVLGRTDRILVAAEDGTLFAWLSDGNGNDFMWEPANDGQQVFGGKCTLDRLRFADLTDSGRADVVCIVGTNQIGK